MIANILYYQVDIDWLAGPTLVASPALIRDTFYFAGDFRIADLIERLAHDPEAALAWNIATQLKQLLDKLKHLTLLPGKQAPYDMMDLVREQHPGNSPYYPSESANILVGWDTNVVSIDVPIIIAKKPKNILITVTKSQQPLWYCART